MSDSIFLTDGNGAITGLVDFEYAGELVIPEYVGSERITAINEGAFYNCRNLTSIILPDSVTSIGDGAFTSCRNLMSLSIPNSVITIGEQAFADCQRLVSVVIPDSVISIGNQAFAACPSLTTVYISDPNNPPAAVSSYDWSNTGSSGVTFVQDPRSLDYFIKGGTLIDIGDKIRVLSGTENTMTPAEMQSNLDAVAEKMDSALFLESETKTAQLPSSANWLSVTYGDGKFVALASGSTAAAYSIDGITWTATTMPSSDYWWSAAYGNGKFVVTTSGSDKAAYSTDGINWTAATMPSSAQWRSVTYGGGKFVAMARNSNKAAYSTDGITWTEATLPISQGWTSVAYGNDIFVAVAQESTVAAYSTDGITWTSSEMSAWSCWGSITYGNGRFVVVESGAPVDSNVAIYSDDGITWTVIQLPVSDYWQSVTYGDDKFVAITYNSDKAVYSTDGITWTATTMPSNQYWHSITYGNGKFVAVTDRSDTAAYSIDGITWFDSIIETSIINNSNIDVTEETIQATKLLDPEMATQDNLIAQITAALEGKMIPEAKKTVSITLNADGLGVPSTVYYLTESGEQATANSGTIEAFKGVVYIPGAYGSVSATGDYVYMRYSSAYYVYIFLSDGGILEANSSSGGSN